MPLQILDPESRHQPPVDRMLIVLDDGSISMVKIETTAESIDSAVV
jgi:hypothetical protein